MDKEIWITFAEAIFRMSSKLLFILDFQAKPLLRDVVAAKRVSGRGELRERGRLIFSLNDKGLDSDPNVIRAPGGFYYEAESYPAEVRFDEFSAWIDELAASDRDAFFPSSQIANPKPVSTHQIEVAPMPKRRRTYRSPKQEKVLPFLNQLFPGGAPDRSKLTDAELVEKVLNQMGERDSNSLKDSILRAADRRK